MSCRAESLIDAATADDAVAEATAELLVAVVAALSDPRSDIGAPAWRERGFAAEIGAHAAAELGLALPQAGGGRGRRDACEPGAAPRDRVRAPVRQRASRPGLPFVGLVLPREPSRRRRRAARRAHRHGEPRRRRRPRDGRRRRVPSSPPSPCCCSNGGCDEARACLTDHLEPVDRCSFADRFAAEARLPAAPRSRRAVLQALFAPAGAEAADERVSDATVLQDLAARGADDAARLRRGLARQR